ncbi:MAG: Mrp/NBP35 family ATP-binding protein [Bacteriovoracaceae bacterium]|nr:Mrp/NBP35 family ATP-binding protein [Bacteriovoracaceae bacterium]
MSFNKEYIDETNAIRENISNIRNKIIVMSGKGGVGKSTISSNLAGFLSLEGFQTGLLDIDLHGPSIPKLLGLSGKSLEIIGDKLSPIEYSSTLKTVSIGFMLKSEDESIIWRGPKKNSMIRQFLKDVHWGNLDYLIIDSPPGTGDEQLSIIQTTGDLNGAVIVTTPQDISLIDVKKSINFCRQLNLPIIGIIENMSGLICPKCNERINVFKSNGGKELAEEEKIPFLGKISLDPSTANNCDNGTLTINSNASRINRDEMMFAFKNILERKEQIK